MLETVREFARELLAASGELEATARAHAERYAGLAAAGEPHLEGPERHLWLNRLEVELPNLRAALAWAREAGETEFGLQTAARLLRLWEQVGVREGAVWLDGLLALDAPVAPAVQARALHARSVLALWAGDYARADRDGEASLALYGSLGDRRGAAAVLNYLAGAAWEQGLIERATELCEQSLAERRCLGIPADIGTTLTNLATLRRERSDEDPAPLLLEALDYQRQCGNDRGVVTVLVFLADIALVAGRPDEAEALLDQCEAVGREGPIQTVAGTILTMRAHLARVRGDLAGAAHGYRQALCSRLQIGHAGRAAYCIEGLAAVAWLSGDPGRAARLYGAVAAVRARARQRPERSERELHEGIVAEVRGALGEDRFRPAWDAGRRLSLEEAVAEVMDP
jgi:non-specific serine/threonine protein kinase